MSTIHRDDGTAVSFSADEWICVRYCYANQGVRGESSRLITGGTITGQALADLHTMIERASRITLERKLDYDISNGQGAASTLLFKLIKDEWKLPYTRVYAAGVAVFRGTKRLGKLEDDPTLDALIVRLRDVPVFAAAFAKLSGAVEGARTLDVVLAR